MSQFVLCRVCLAHNIRMHPLDKTHYQEIYEKYAGRKLLQLITGDGRMNKVCYICNALLLRFHKFMQMSQKAEKHLTEMYCSGIEITVNNTPTLANKIQCVSLTNFSSLSLTDQPDTACVRIKPVDSTIEDINDQSVESSEDVAVKIESVDYEENESYLAEENVNYHVDVENDHVDVENGHVDVEKDFPVEANQHIDVEIDCPVNPDVGHVDNSNVDVEIDCDVDVEVLNHVDMKNTYLDYSHFNKPVKEIETEVPKKPEIKMSDVRVTLERIQIPKIRSKKRGHHCPSCPRRFRSASLLRRHKCQQALAPVYLQTLRRGPAQYHCDLCDRHFKHKSMYLVHHRTHTGEKPYECKFCDRVFNDKSNCRKHMNKHVLWKHACLMCDRTFSERKLLVKHSVEHIL